MRGTLSSATEMTDLSSNHVEATPQRRYYTALMLYQQVTTVL